MKKVLLALVHTVAMSYLTLLALLSMVHTLFPSRSGLLALSQVFAPYLFVPLPLVLPVAWFRRSLILRVGLVLCALLFLVRFTPRFLAVSPHEEPGALHVTVMNWNVYVGGREDQIKSMLAASRSDIVALEEVSWSWIESDTQLTRIYPHRSCIYPGDRIGGMCLLSIYPIIEERIPAAPPGTWDQVRVLSTRLDLGEGRTLRAVVAHPPPPYIARAGFPLVGPYDTSKRDATIAHIRAAIDPYLRDGEPLLLLGDFNVTEREPAYSDLTRDLLDAFALRGEGNGNTWGPPALPLFGWTPFLRIDYLLSSRSVVPLSAVTNCTPHGSDHCIVRGRFEIR